MKKVIILVVSAVIVIAGGYIGMKYVEKKEQEEHFWKKQEARVEKYIHYNIENVESITFSDHSVSPMGVPQLKGYINNNKKLWFIGHISNTKNFEDHFGRSGELGKLIKDPEKSVSEIEKEEKAKNQE
ncbi:DUF1433 domain-containing protein [Bacillus mycoides]|uniref:DUF1433 domain-containing protein n=1 Tax=Bacillus mycoides TaxID=1405 RepID=UPI001C02C0B1|nr:DUF1433 domain-containing protein [Bacillus mycoides]QWH27364.1 DUF1433 domain-containing protein [Bacillus mycoides]